ncbi:MAG TPA: efflux RND transporter periplasmic adaptor subunit [Novosphingobium sp.]
MRPASGGFVRRHRWAVGLTVALVLGIGWKVTTHPATPPAPPPATVGVAAPLVRDVTQWDQYIGRFSASQVVEVRPRVSGAVTAIHFRDGDVVRKGALLFTIDPRPYAAALAEARANAAAARSALVLAQSDLARAARLTGDEAIAASEVDALRAKVQAARATLAAAEARARARALDLEFTAVRAPIAGRISDRRVDIGNLVAGEGGAGASLLTTINALDPIYFDFDASEALYLKAQRDRAANRQPATVQVRLLDEPTYRWEGRLDFTDNGLDPRSGTIRVRAKFANPNLFLTPGLFGNMRMAGGGAAPALLVPEAAVQTDQAHKTVLVIGGDGTVDVRPIEPGPVVDGLRVVRSGLAPTDRVVVSNFAAAMPGARVRPVPGRIVPAPMLSTPVAAPPPVAAQATFAR